MRALHAYQNEYDLIKNLSRLREYRLPFTANIEPLCGISLATCGKYRAGEARIQSRTGLFGFCFNRIFSFLLLYG